MSAAISLRQQSATRSCVGIALAMLLSGCASTAIQDNFRSVQDIGKDRLGADVRWLTSDEARRQAKSEVEARLKEPLGSDDAVRIAVGYSPALQTLLFEAAARSA